jgi:hypothetical protein
VKNAEFVFIAKSTDYHSEMNSHIFRDWIGNTALPLLDRLSCLIMDNAYYHNKVAREDKVPTSSSTKDEIEDMADKGTTTI